MQLAAIGYSWGSRPTQQAARPRHSVNDKLDRDSLPIRLLCAIRARIRTVATLSGPERELCPLFDLLMDDCTYVLCLALCACVKMFVEILLLRFQNTVLNKVWRAVMLTLMILSIKSHKLVDI